MCACVYTYAKHGTSNRLCIIAMTRIYHNRRTRPPERMVHQESVPTVNADLHGHGRSYLFCQAVGDTVRSYKLQLHVRPMALRLGLR